MTPTPPNAIKGTVTASSPESTAKPSGTDWQTRAIWPISPEASLTPTMVSISARRASRSGAMLQQVRLGTL